MPFSRLGYLIARMARSLWFRPALSAFAALAAAALTPVVEPLIPSVRLTRIAEADVAAILSVLSSSMLAVAIFSLGTMVSALQAASGAATPRARPLLTEDGTAQTAISTFIGAFLFSVLGQVGLALELYDPAGLVVVFATALILIAAVTVALVAWIRALSAMGGVAEAIERVEQATSDAFAALACAPCFGGGEADGPPPGAEPVAADEFGFVQHVDAGTLNALAHQAGGMIHICARPGARAHPGKLLAHATGRLDDAARASIRAAFTLGRARAFDNDPRFGLIALSEIASRALSPAVNDPGTAIDVLAAQTRALAEWRAAVRRAARPDGGLAHSRLTAAPLASGDLFEDAFRPIARDGAGMVEVVLRMRRSLLALAQADPAAFSEAAQAMEAYLAERAGAALTARADRAALDAARR